MTQPAVLQPLSKWPQRGPLVITLPRSFKMEIATRRALAANITVAEMRSPTRVWRISHPRQEAMAEMHQAGFSHSQIVAFFGFKNHTTSVHACQEVIRRTANQRPFQRREVA